jgi:hypothetical protein
LGLFLGLLLALLALAVPAAAAPDDPLPAATGGGTLPDAATPADTVLPAGPSAPVDVAVDPAAGGPIPPATRRVLYLPFSLREGWLYTVDPVRFSHPHGLYDAPFRLELTTRPPAALIRYTVDGSPPGPAHGEIYVEPILIEGTTIVRAAAFRAGHVPAPVTTTSFLFPADVLGQSNAGAVARGWPAEWGVFPSGPHAGRLVPADYGLRSRIVAQYGSRLPQALRSLPSLSLVMRSEDLFDPLTGIYANTMMKGADWERPVSAELIRSDGEEGFQVDAGIRIAGGVSRQPDSMPKHSFRLVFRSRYGAKSLDYPLFPGSPVRRFESLRLRGGQADTFAFFAHKAQYVHDEWARVTQADMGWPTARGRFVHLYINGLYWGLYDLTEELTAPFAAAHVGGDPDDWDVIKDGDLVDGQWGVAVEDGRIDDFNAMVGLARSHPRPDPSDRRLYDDMAARLNIPQAIDYTLIQIFAANWDWPNKNWVAAHNRRLQDGFQLFLWDVEHSTALRDDPARGMCISPVDPRTGQCGYKADTAGVQDLHGWLKHFPEYRLQFADRVQRHAFNTGNGLGGNRPRLGALTPDATRRRYEDLAHEIEQAVIGESARWGFARPPIVNEQINGQVWQVYRRRFPQDGPQTQAHWLLERDRLLAEHFPQRTRIVVQQLCDQRLYPWIAAPEVASEDASPRLVMRPGSQGCADRVPGSTIFYTLDGSDPRQPWSGDPAVPWSGEPAPSARRYLGPVKLTGFAHLRTRAAVQVDGQWRWSALVETDFGVPRLAVTEIMYHPPEGSELEFVELQSLEETPVDVSGIRISGAITYTAPAESTLLPGQRLVLVSDPTAFGPRHPGVRVDGVFTGKLDNAGETMAIRGADGQRWLEVSYQPDGFWPRSPDGWGYSLVLVSPFGDVTDPENWRASSEPGGSPGSADPATLLPPVVINEILANSSPPLEDAIELHNLGSYPADVGGWYLSDNPDTPQKYRIPDGTIIPPDGTQVLYEADFNAGSDPFALSALGETVLLSSADGRGALTGYMRGVDCPIAQDGVSLGRYRTSVGLAFVALATRTFGADDPETVEMFRQGRGAPNAGPLVGPVVLSELMVNPAQGGSEFIELQNITDRAVPLHDPQNPKLAWRFSTGVTYTFGAGTLIPPGGRMVIAGSDPDNFRQAAAVPAEVPVVGPFEGKLKNEGEVVTLAKPSLAGFDEPADIPVDAVGYDDQTPWPALANGQGPSLERRDVSTYGDDPVNWLALHPGGTPGRPNTRAIRAYLPLLWVADP